MKKLTKIMTGVLAGAVIPMALAGCAGQGTEPAQTTTEAVTTEATTEAVTESTTAESTTTAAASSDVLKAVYDNYTKEGSKFSENLKQNKEYFSDIDYDVKLEDGKIVISTEGSTEGNIEAGTWEFVQDGDYLTFKGAADDYSGAIFFEFFKDAVAEALKMDKDLFSSYLSGLQLTQPDNKYISQTEESDGTILYKMYDAAPFEMTGIDDMYVTEELAKEYLIKPDGPTGDTFSSIPIGKIHVVSHGNSEDMTIAVGEYGESTDKSLKSLINAVNAVQPKGYEAFVKDFTEIKEVSGDDYSVSLTLDDETKEYLGIKDDATNFKFVVVNFGK